MEKVEFVCDSTEQANRLRAAVKKFFKKEEKIKPINKRECSGCEDDFYNGKNPFNVLECSRLKTAIIVPRKKVSVNQVPPWTQKATKYPDCYHQKGYIFVGKDVIR